MARVLIMSGPAVVQIREEQDEDGEYAWDCLTCGADPGDRGYQPLEDTIQEASQHADDRCPGGPGGDKEEAP